MIESILIVLCFFVGLTMFWYMLYFDLVFSGLLAVLCMLIIHVCKVEFNKR